MLSLRLKVRVLTLAETLLYECVHLDSRWAALRQAPVAALSPSAGHQRRRRADYTTLSYVKAPRRHDARALKRPSVNDGSSSRGPGRDKATCNYHPVG